MFLALLSLLNAILGVLNVYLVCIDPERFGSHAVTAGINFSVAFLIGGLAVACRK